MTEQDFDRTGGHADGDAPVGAPSAAPERVPAETGNAAVDAVIAGLSGLGDAPVDEHVVLFERAHEQLRSALDAPAGPRPPAVPGSND